MTDAKGSVFSPSYCFSGTSVRGDGSLAVYKPIDPEDFLREFGEAPLGKSMAKIPA